MSSTDTPTRRGPRWIRWIGWGFFGLVLALEVLTMGEAGLGKFENREGWMYWFGVFGYPGWMALVVGGAEVIGAVLLLVPRVASYAAIGLTVIMIGALHAVLTNETDLGWFDPLLHITFLAIIGSVQWKRRWRVGGRPTMEAMSPTV